MKTKPLVCAALSLSIGFSGLAFAQDDKDVRADQAARGRNPVAIPRDDHRGGPPGRYVPAPGRGDPRQAWSGPRHGEGPGGGPDHNFYRGDRLPPEWRSRQYVVDDWRGHHLSAPPRGYHWVQAGGDYVLVAIATGIIASILLNQ